MENGVWRFDQRRFMIHQFNRIDFVCISMRKSLQNPTKTPFNR